MGERIACLLYATMVLLVGVWCFRNPMLNWDLIQYSAQVFLLEGQDADAVYEGTYAELKAEIPADRYRDLVGDPDVLTMKGANPMSVYRLDVATNRFHFAEQFPLYAAKPLYVAVVSVLHRLGLGLVRATLVPSIVSWALLCLLAFKWVGLYLQGVPQLVCSSLACFSPPALLLPRLSTPDSLSALLVLLALYFLLEKQSLTLFSGLLLLSLFVRTNNLIVLSFVLSYLVFRARGRLRITIFQYAVLLSVGVAVVFTINHFSGYYGWSTLFYDSLISPLTAPAEALVHVPAKTYLLIVKGCLLNLALESYVPLFIFIGMVAVFLLSHGRPEPTRQTYRDLTVLLLATIPVCFLLLPSFGRLFLEERYIDPQFMFFGVAFAVGLAERTKVDTTAMLIES